MTVSRFLLSGGVVLAGSLAAVEPLRRTAGPDVALGVAAGTLLAASGAAVWLAVFLRARGRDPGAFLRYFLGGVIVRLIGMAMATLLAVALTTVHLPSFVGSLFLSYIVYQILEIALVWSAGPHAARNGGTAP